MAKHRKSKRSRKSSSSSGSDSDSSSRSSSSSKSFSSTFSDITDLKVKKCVCNRRKSSVLAKWITRGVGERNLKAAREVPGFFPYKKLMMDNFRKKNIQQEVEV